MANRPWATLGILLLLLALPAGAQSLPPPVLLEPEPGFQVQSGNVTLKWQNVTGATRYALQVIQVNPPLSTLLVDEQSIFATTYGFTTGLIVDRTYEWKVASNSGNEQGPFGEVRDFTVTGPPPPTPISPPNNSLVRLPVTLDWSDMVGFDVDKYFWFVNPAGGSPGVPLEGNVMASQSNVTLDSGLTAGAKYEWKVQSRNAFGLSRNFSELRNFTPGATPPSIGPPPANAAIKISGNVTDKNGPIPGATVKSLDSTYAGATTDSLGHYEFYVNPGTHTVEARAKGFAPQKRTVGVTGDVTVDFKMEKARVILVIIDGLGSNQMENYLSDLTLTPANSGLKRMEKEGALLTQVTTVFPSYTAPAHTSILTGTYPGTHGIVGNEAYFKGGLRHGLG